jgi:hypothetical protein
MKLTVTATAAGKTYNTTMDVPSPAEGKAPPHVVANTVVQAVSTSVNQLASVNLDLDTLTVAVER